MEALGPGALGTCRQDPILTDPLRARTSASLAISGFHLHLVGLREPRCTACSCTVLGTCGHLWAAGQGEGARRGCQERG